MLCYHTSGYFKRWDKQGNSHSPLCRSLIGISGPNQKDKVQIFLGAAMVPCQMCYLDGLKGHATEKGTVAKTKMNKKRASSSCFQWMQGKDCSFADSCKYAHSCTSCGITAPKKHVLDTCSRKSTIEAGLKKKKVKLAASTWRDAGSGEVPTNGDSMFCVQFLSNGRRATGCTDRSFYSKSDCSSDRKNGGLRCSSTLENKVLVENYQCTTKTSTNRYKLNLPVSLPSNSFRRDFWCIVVWPFLQLREHEPIVLCV